MLYWLCNYGGTEDELKAAIDDWMDYYNNDMYQESLAKLSPNKYYDYNDGDIPVKDKKDLEITPSLFYIQTK